MKRIILGAAIVGSLLVAAPAAATFCPEGQTGYPNCVPIEPPPVEPPVTPPVTPPVEPPVVPPVEPPPVPEPPTPAPPTPDEPAAPPTTPDAPPAISELPFTGNEVVVLVLAGIALIGTGLLMRRGAAKRRYDDDALLREREDAGWSPRMDWNWPKR